MAKKNILQTLHEFVDNVLELFTPEQLQEQGLVTIKQAISMPDVYNAVYSALNPPPYDETQPYKSLIDCYIDGLDIYAVIGMDGKLYKVPVTVIPGGVTLGDLEQVEIAHNPVSQSFKVMQQADGQYRWFAFPAATAVLNKNGYLNSRELYDNFIKHIQDGDAPYPYLTFYHVGEALVLGQADFVERDGYTLLMSGTFNDTPLAQCLAKDPTWNGDSIGYLNNEDAVQSILVDETVKLPVHTDGILLEVSALQDKDAACIMTAFYSKGVTQMNQATLEKLKKLAGNNADALAQVDVLANTVDQVNQTIEDENLVRQAQDAPVTVAPPTDPAPVAEPVATPPVADPTPTLANDPVFTLSDEALQAVADQVHAGFVTEISALTATLQSKLDAVNVQLSTLVTGLQSRIEALEMTDQQKVSQALVDMPRNVITVGVRPRVANQPIAQTEPNAEQDSEAQVAPVLEMLHRTQAKAPVK